GASVGCERPIGPTGQRTRRRFRRRALSSRKEAKARLIFSERVDAQNLALVFAVGRPRASRSKVKGRGELEGGRPFPAGRGRPDGSPVVFASRAFADVSARQILKRSRLLSTAPRAPALPPATQTAPPSVLELRQAVVAGLSVSVFVKTTTSASVAAPPGAPGPRYRANSVSAPVGRKLFAQRWLGGRRFQRFGLRQNDDFGVGRVDLVRSSVLGDREAKEPPVLDANGVDDDAASRDGFPGEERVKNFERGFGNFVSSLF
ncbi:MAG: hypothetical protein IJO46_09625, partial [Thermoguttaceae bacterium]|nr:hypothetical protein [Thermoguttaceae bacterium]